MLHMRLPAALFLGRFGQKVIECATEGGQTMSRFRVYVIAFVLVCLLVVLGGRLVRRLGIGGTAGSLLGQASKTGQEQVAAPTPKPEAKTSQPKKDPLSSTAAVLPIRHIEGLMLHLSRPLLFDASDVRGLAAEPRFFYVAASDPQNHTATLYRVRRDTYEVDDSRSLEIGSMFSLGGVHLGQQWLWVPLSQGTPTPVSLILGIDPFNLETQNSFAVDREIAAVAQGLDGLIYGIDADASSFYVWNAHGDEIQRIDNSTHIQYTDLEIVRGKVVAVGVTPIETGGNREVCGVLDVLDPVSFALRARHLSHARSVQGNLVTRAGFAFTDDEFCFLPDDGDMAMLLTYHLDRVGLADYIP
jgi:hypothetical protein